MHARIPNLSEVTHMYYCAYANTTAYSENVMQIKDINVEMTYNAVHATDTLCSELNFLVLQIGTNLCGPSVRQLLRGGGGLLTLENYGVAVFQYKDQIEINPQLEEDSPRIPSPYGDEIFYYAQVDLIKNAAKGKT
ncbi:uncharacterized protein N7529_001316 [Penicillium soppii]|uniref:uncharacterized protein n=1 Tax=Penicillium soppii TaxID=69789 RepID=UPI002547EF1F|nr:uncharacterized protein N7529_001316 [Penicillium soppii]KAJ5882644.1 hypothetical protein N7529_001316 [Penicillium soppii]